MKILVTGGAGYIGSHTCIQLLEAGHTVVVVDNLLNSKRESLSRVQAITAKSIDFYQVDLLDEAGLRQVFEQAKQAGAPIEAVIHFAGLKAVGESVAKPLLYYHNNLTATFVLCKVMAEFLCKNLIFSSSATVYGLAEKVPLAEDSPLGATNPYGRTKLFIEEILRDIYRSDSSWNIVLLRYFNPVGAHESGRLGEDPNGIPNNLVPYIAQVAIGKLPSLRVYGNDYSTPDGTGVRDYIHIKDLAQGHLQALTKLGPGDGLHTYNLGSGKGSSVLQMLAAFEKACGKKLSRTFEPRRAGDIAICYADPTLANQELGWTAVKTIDDMCADTWRWQSMNPNGLE